MIHGGNHLQRHLSWRQGLSPRCQHPTRGALIVTALDTHARPHTPTPQFSLELLHPLAWGSLEGPRPIFSFFSCATASTTGATAALIEGDQIDEQPGSLALWIGAAARHSMQRL